MATKSVVCPECEAPLSPGRFACPSCGALVAAVATVARSFSLAEPILPPVLAPSIPDEAPPSLAVHARSAFEEPLPPRLARVLQPARKAASTPRAEKPGPSERIATAVAAPRPSKRAQGPAVRQAPLTWVLDEPAPAQPAPAQPASAQPASLPPEPVQSVSAPVVPVRLPNAPTAPAYVAEPTELARPVHSSPEPSWPAHPVWPPPKPVDEVIQRVEPPIARVAAGAYLPPSAVLPPGESLPIAGAPRIKGSADAGSPPAREASVPLRARLRFGDGTGPLGMPAEVPTRVVVLGAALAALGFLLPWADIVIGNGSGRIGGYLDRWGLAGPGHVIILAIIVGLAFLALVAERLPRWARLGLPSIALASLLTGIIWPYLVGPFAASIGVYVVAVGAVVMIAGGLLDRIATRHVDAATSV